VTLVRLQGRWVGTFGGDVCIGRLPAVLRWLDCIRLREVFELQAWVHVTL
jgi:hypothetical protein